MDTEEWRTCVIDGEEWSNYEVSTYGRVRSLNYRRTGKIEILEQMENSKSGYLLINLCKNGKSKMYYVHRCVACTFTDLIPNDNPTEKTEVDHIDRNRKNNHVSNLRWTTRQGNIDNADQSGKSKRVLCVETGIIYDSTCEASRQTGIPQGNISRCCNGKHKTVGGFHWKYYTEDTEETEESES